MGTTPELEADLVMRGGITSGIVYPKAVAEIAKTYRFRSIGGASVGAIAAAITAAAEYRRTAGKKTGAFGEVEKLPGELAHQELFETKLATLFTPDRPTRASFDLLMALLSPKTMLGRAHAVLAFFAGYAAFFFAFPLISALAWSWRPQGAADELLVLLFLLCAMCAIGVATVAVVVAATWFVTRQAKAIRDNEFGICSTVAKHPRTGPFVTDWMHETIQNLAGKPLDDPLTFGDLWGAGGGPGRGIELVTTATDVSHGRSLRAPEMLEPFFFREADLVKVLPADVVRHMAARARDKLARKQSDELWILQVDGADAADILPMPRLEDIPIVFAARISMSFPVMISAVRLYEPIKFERDAGKRTVCTLAPTILTDGGVTSNFPIHLFDDPAPSRPTFCINLVPREATLLAWRSRTEDPAPNVVAGGGGGRLAPDDVWLPATNDLTPLLHNDFAVRKKPAPQALGAFLGAIFDAARLWRDEELARMPGHRDRIVHVKLAPDEGGLNLRMDPSQIAKIADRGKDAGQTIAARFAPGQTAQIGFANHRWVRFRTFMDALDRLVRRFDASHAASEAAAAARQEPGIADMLHGATFPHKVGYSLDGPQRAALETALKETLKFAAAFPPNASDKPRAAPSPKSELRLQLARGVVAPNAGAPQPGPQPGSQPAPQLGSDGAAP